MGVIEPLSTVQNGRDQAGRFGAGNSGRPRGALNRVSKATLTAVQDLASLAVFKLREQIDLGNMVAIKLCLDATLPRNGRTIELESTDPLTVADALAVGEITPDEADKIASAYGKLQGIHEVEDLRKRLDELETAVAERRR